MDQKDQDHWAQGWRPLTEAERRDASRQKRDDLMWGVAMTAWAVLTSPVTLLLVFAYVFALAT
jgi:hypothetical protein